MSDKSLFLDSSFKMCRAIKIDSKCEVFGIVYEKGCYLLVDASVGVGDSDLLYSVDIDSNGEPYGLTKYFTSLGKVYYTQEGIYLNISDVEEINGMKMYKYKVGEDDEYHYISKEGIIRSFILKKVLIL